MSSLHFFTEIDLLNSQASTETFGPAGTSSGAENFRVTDLHSSNGTPSAIAISDGTVCIQQDYNNSAVVNLILKPSQQPVLNLPKVAYFVYKGILKNSLISNGEVIVDPSNDLATSINNSQIALNVAIDQQNGNPPGTTTDPASEKSLGIDLNSSITNFGDADLISNLFFRGSIAFQLPETKAGWVMGQFDPQLFGLEIILCDYGYEPKLGATRVVDHLVSVNVLGPSPTDAQIFKHDHDKEEILNYMDCAAFFGSFYSDRLFVKSSLTNFNDISGNDIYNEVLRGTIHTTTNGNFYNRERVYLDIRNENNYSFNYYKNYGTDVLLAFENDRDLLAPVNYYQNSWPIIYFDSSNFPQGNSTGKNVILLSLPSGDNSYPVVYVASGFRNNIGDNFRSLKGRRKFFEPHGEHVIGFKESIALKIPNNSDAVDTTVIANYTRICYIRRFENADLQNPSMPSSPTVLPKNHYLDNIFSLSFNSLIAGNARINYRVYENASYINVIEESDHDYFGALGIASDVDNVTFFAFAEDINKRIGSSNNHRVSFTSGLSEQFDHFSEFLSTKFPQMNVVKGDFVIGAQNINYIRSQNSNLESLRVFLTSNPQELVALTIDNATYSNFSTLILNAGLDTNFRIYLAFGNRILSEDDRGQKYYQHEILLRGYKENSGVLEIVDINTNTNFYQYAILPDA